MAAAKPVGTIYDASLGAVLDGLAAAGASAAISHLHIGSVGAGGGGGDAASAGTAAPPAAAARGRTPEAGSAPARPAAETGGATCVACGIGVGGLDGFSSPAEQREHFRSDWHRANVQRRARGRAALSEGEFERLVTSGRDSDLESLSGSGTDDEDEGEGEGAGRDWGGRGGGAPSVSPLVAIPDGRGRVLGVWRCMLTPDRTAAKAAERAAERAGERGGMTTAAPTAPGTPGNVEPSPDAAPGSVGQVARDLRALRASDTHVGVLMLRGGHFVAAVFELQPTRIADTTRVDKFAVLAHRSAHRYVVRAKAGGKQSAQDASGKYAKSAGSRLRRHNEVLLAADVAQGLRDLRPLFATCSAIFVHAPGSNLRDLFKAETEDAASTHRSGATGSQAAPPPLSPADLRIRNIPFTTRRPTFSESQRVVRVLVSLYDLGEDATASEAAVAPPDDAPGTSATTTPADGPDTGPGRVPAGGLIAAPLEPEPTREPTAAELALAKEAMSESLGPSKAQVKKQKQRERARAEKEARRAAEVRAREEALAAQDVERAAAEAAREVAQAATRERERRAARAATAAARATGGRGAGRGGAGGVGRSIGSTSGVTMAAKPKADESPEVRRARMAAAAEARAAALARAAAAQKLL